MPFFSIIRFSMIYTKLLSLISMIWKLTNKFPHIKFTSGKSVFKLAIFSEIIKGLLWKPQLWRIQKASVVDGYPCLLSCQIDFLSFAQHCTVGKVWGETASNCWNHPGLNLLKNTAAVAHRTCSTKTLSGCEHVWKLKHLWFLSCKFTKARYHPVVESL